MVATVAELMGTAEICARLGVSRQRVQQLTARPDWPAPVATLRSGRIYRAEDVEAWIREHRPEDE